jgi:hypothetical protein
MLYMLVCFRLGYYILVQSMLVCYVLVHSGLVYCKLVCSKCQYIMYYAIPYTGILNTVQDLGLGCYVLYATE